MLRLCHRHPVSVCTSHLMFVKLKTASHLFHGSSCSRSNRRFFKGFGGDNVEAISVRGNVFVLLNSMALDDDDCFMCSATRKELRDLSLALSCSQVRVFRCRKLAATFGQMRKK